MKILNWSVLIVLLVGIGMVACKKDSATTITCSGESISYATQVAPLIASKCATSGCHN